MTPVVVPAGDAPAVFVPRSGVLRGWLEDWDRWRSGPEAAAGLCRWSVDPVLAPHCSSVAAMVDGCGRDETVPEQVADVRLAALTRFAVGGDTAAVRVVLERITPTLAVRAGVHARRTGLPFSVVFADLTGAAWLVVRTYPLDRYPHRVALRMVSRAVYRVWGYRPIVERRSVPAADAPDEAARLDGRSCHRDLSPAAELVDVLADAAAAGAPEAALRLVAELGVAGWSAVELAGRDGVSDRTVRNRRAAAVAAVRAALLGDVPAGRAA